MNVEKTKAVVFRRNQGCEHAAINLKYGTLHVEQVTEYKYLGVILDECLNYKKHNEAMASSGSRALGGVIGKTIHLRDLGFDTYDQLVRSCVFSILDYGAEVTGYVRGKNLEDVQYRAARFFLGLNKFSPLPCLNAEMGWYSCHTRHLIAMNSEQILRTYNEDGFLKVA